MGENIRWVARNFESLEPGTLKWIESFDNNDTFLDIGASSGWYSLYAAHRNIKVISVEPDSANYAILNFNILKNNFNELITAYCLAIHNSSTFSFLNKSDQSWLNALNSFENNMNYEGKLFDPVFKQGIFGISLDEFLNNIKYYPSHIKIDVDGNELLVIKGAKKTLESKFIKSLLIEITETRKDHNEIIEIITKAGFKIYSRQQGNIWSQSQFSNCFNYIFIKE